MAKYIDIARVLVEIGFAKSISEACRLIKQGAVKIYPPNTTITQIMRDK